MLGSVTLSHATSVLVVEDDEALRVLFIALLKRKGFEVECVYNGAQALERLAETSYSVILLDLMMPVTNGFDVLRRFAEQSPWLLRQTIVTTGVSQRDLEKVDRDSVFAILRKPFDIDTLISTVNDCARSTNRRARPAPAEEDDGETKLDASVRRFEETLPQLRQILAVARTSDRELLLCNQLRRAVGKLGGVLTDAASVQDDTRRARHYQELAITASSLAAGRIERSRQEH